MGGKAKRKFDGAVKDGVKKQQALMTPPPAPPAPTFLGMTDKEREEATATKQKLKALEASSAKNVLSGRQRTAANFQTTQLTDTLGLSTSGASNTKSRKRITLG